FRDVEQELSDHLKQQHPNVVVLNWNLTIVRLDVHLETVQIAHLCLQPTDPRSQALALQDRWIEIDAQLTRHPGAARQEFFRVLELARRFSTLSAERILREPELELNAVEQLLQVVVQDLRQPAPFTLLSAGQRGGELARFTRPFLDAFLERLV